LVMLQAGVLCVSVPLFHYVGLSLELKTATIVFVLGGPFVIPWLYFLRYPGRNPRDWIFAESFFVLTLTLTTVLITGPAQYVAAGLGFPTIERQLLALDHAMHIDVPGIVSWTRFHPYWSYWLAFGYNAFRAEIVFIPLGLGIAFQDRESLWEYTWHLLVCAVLTIILFALFPARPAPLVENFEPRFDVSIPTAHFLAMHDGQ